VGGIREIHPRRGQRLSIVGQRVIGESTDAIHLKADSTLQTLE
jgi:hypothetical protein